MSIYTEQQVQQLGKASRKVAFLSLASFLIVAGSLIYSAVKLNSLRTSVEKKQSELTVLQKQIEPINQRVKELNQRVDELRSTQEDILNFLAKVTSAQDIKLIDRDVDWEKTKQQIMSLPAGQRKQAALAAVLLAWKYIPFKLGGNSLKSGFDSPRFVKFVLFQVGIEVEQLPNERLSETLMRSFKKVDKPQPGDLIFYKGNVGSFVMIYLAEGRNEGKGVCVGTLQPGEPVQIMDSADITTDSHPFIGYFSPNYSN
jgi:cell wall-associated NlpC family hydrolase